MKLNVSDIIGKKFGKLTVKKFLRSDKSKYPWKYYYSCTCDCGVDKILARTNLTIKLYILCLLKLQ